MARWRYKMLKKEQIDEIVCKYKSKLYIEIDMGSRIGRHLMAKGENSRFIFGRVPSNIFKWYNLVQTSDQPLAINLTWYKFEDTQTSPTIE